MNVLGFKPRTKTTQRKSAHNVPLDKLDTKALERVSNLDTDSKWAGSSSPPGSPSSPRRKLRKFMKKGLVPCDVIDSSESKVTIFAKRGYTMSTAKNSMLGEGAFGQVILVTGRKQQRVGLEETEATVKDEPDVRYACKIINTEKAKDKDGKEKDKFEKRLREFANELHGLNAGHSHPHIVQMFDAFIVEKYFYIVMEFADSKDLYRQVHKYGPYPESRARRYFLQIGSAVNFLHAQHIAHRDIKCHNVLMKKEMNIAAGRRKQVCKLTDMGLSVICWTKEGGPKYMRSHAGTKFAFAPEIVECELRKGKEIPYLPLPADIWALGVVLYQMLCRSFPFNTIQSQKMLKLQKNIDFEFTRKSPLSRDGRKKAPKQPPLTEEVKHLIRMMFNPDPIARWTWNEISRHPWIHMKSGESRTTHSE